MTQPWTSDAHNLTSPSHSRRHSCYYISATTANDALASQLNQKNVPTLVQRKTHNLKRLRFARKDVANYIPVVQNNRCSAV